MSTSLCRLCASDNNDCKSLYDEFGQGNEIYEITVKYFDPMFLNSQQYPHLSMVICMECWQHISDFHTFQQSVLNAQTKFEKDFKEIVTNIKLEENESAENQSYHNVLNNNSVDADEKNKIFWPDVDISISDIKEVVLPDLNTTDLKEDENEDENPLIEILPKNPRKRRGRPKKLQSTLHSETAKKRKGINKQSQSLKIENEEYDHDFQESINDNEYNDSDIDDQQADPDAFVSSNDTQKTRKQKRKEIDSFIAKWKQELECDICKQIFNNFTLLRKHFKSDHPEQKCYVSCCQRKLKQRFNIVEHIRYHIDSNTFKCGMCDKVFISSRNLNYHMNEKHTAEGQERPFQCTICKKCFGKKGALKNHLETHDTDKDYECSECGKGFSTEQRRKIHERTVHNVDRVCDQCGKTIHGISALKQHILEHAGVKKQKWPCDLCNAELTSRYSLKRHKAIHNDGSTIYECNECGKIAPTETALKAHKRYAHQSEPKFKCTICDKRFKVAHVLREHMTTHTGEDLYKCPHCPKTFKVNANMHHHRKKAHPKEWAEGRINKPNIKKVDTNLTANKIVI